MSKIAVIGAGAWGTTLAILLAENGHKISLWAYEEETVKQINELKENKIFLPGYPISSNIEATSNIHSLTGFDIYFFVVPTQFLRKTIGQFKKVLSKASIIVSAAKGIEENTLKRPTQIIKDEIELDALALSGPNLSKEIAKGLPAATVVAGKNLNQTRLVQKALSQKRFRVYTNSDVIGVELGGALKNIIAIVAGIADGLELGDNAKSAIIIRGLKEITRLGLALGAKAETFSGLSGIGDLMTTCAGNLSRNHTVGFEIAKGKKLKGILKDKKEIAEGIPTTKSCLELAKKLKVEMPIIQQTYEVLFEGKPPEKAILELMTRSPVSE